MSTSGPIISVERVSKKFSLRNRRTGDLRERFSGLFRREKALPPGDFWALRDISFTVDAGKTLGIIGHNGSGKSTMLKMLTGILAPTEGNVRLRGRVGALIEVGAGFHPDLSGRENIYLNGSILGLSRREIAAKFDAIVAFANLENFIDTPVKRYSSGMYMRLGFAVAAHTDPDILLIDEVLAVGDTLFQRKCLRHLKTFVEKGGAVVFVSHAMGQVTELCQSCVWLDHGRLRYVGPTEDTIEQYMTMVTEREDEEFKRLYPDEWAAREADRLAQEEAERQRLTEVERRQQEEAEREAQEREAKHREAERRHLARIHDPYCSCLLYATLQDEGGERSSPFIAGRPHEIRVGYRAASARSNLVIGIEIFRQDGLYIFAVSNYQYNMPIAVPAGEGEVVVMLPCLALNTGTYYLRVSLFPEPDEPGWDRRPEDVLERAMLFTVEAAVPVQGQVYLPVDAWRPATPSPVGGVQLTG